MFFCVFFLMFWVFFEILVGFQVFGVFFFFGLRLFWAFWFFWSLGSGQLPRCLDSLESTFWHFGDRFPILSSFRGD
jgi:hypothetical protein